MLLFTTAIQAQSFAFFQGDTQLSNNAEINVSTLSRDADTDELLMESGLKFKNLTNKEVVAHVNQIILEHPGLNAGTLSFCFENCIYGMEDKNMEGPIAPNALIEPPFFHVCYYINEGRYAVVKVKYEAYPVDNVNDKTSVTIIYDYNENSTTALNTISSENKITTFQEGNKITFDYSFECNNIQLEVYNLAAEKIAQYHLNVGKGIFTLPEELMKGIYIYTVKNKQQIIATQKFIVR
jgi:hypothetical protein